MSQLWITIILKRELAIITCLALLLTINKSFAASNYIILASTTSTVNSGLFESILPGFTQTSDISVRVIGVGTGQAIKMAERGDADVLLVHHKKSELGFVDKGFGVKRHDVMYNDFILVGPKSDPANIKHTQNVVHAYKNIAASKSFFVSRGDDSGTHKKSLEIWQNVPLDISTNSGGWYREAGSGMGATLNIANSMIGYTLSDRSSWLAFRNKGSLTILFEGDPSLLNQYGIIMVNPTRHKHVKSALASKFINWITGIAGQSAINRFRINGKQTFFANAAAKQN